MRNLYILMHVGSCGLKCTSFLHITCVAFEARFECFVS